MTIFYVPLVFLTYQESRFFFVDKDHAMSISPITSIYYLIVLLNINLNSSINQFLNQSSTKISHLFDSHANFNLVLSRRVVTRSSLSLLTTFMLPLKRITISNVISSLPSSFRVCFAIILRLRRIKLLCHAGR